VRAPIEQQTALCKRRRYSPSRREGRLRAVARWCKTLRPVVLSSGLLTGVALARWSICRADRRRRAWHRDGTGAGPDLSRADPPRHEHLNDSRDLSFRCVQRDGHAGSRVPGTVRRRGAPMKLKPVQTNPMAVLKGGVPVSLPPGWWPTRPTTARPLRNVRGVASGLAHDPVVRGHIPGLPAWRRRVQNGSGSGPMTG
jgi:hypothetical protein